MKIRIQGKDSKELIEQFLKGEKTYTLKDTKVFINGIEIVDNAEIEIENNDYMFMDYDLTARLNGIEKHENESDEDFKKRLIDTIDACKLKGVNDD